MDLERALQSIFEAGVAKSLARRRMPLSLPGQQNEGEAGKSVQAALQKLLDLMTKVKGLDTSKYEGLASPLLQRARGIGPNPLTEKELPALVRRGGHDPVMGELLTAILRDKPKLSNRNPGNFARAGGKLNSLADLLLTKSGNYDLTSEGTRKADAGLQRFLRSASGGRRPVNVTQESRPNATGETALMGDFVAGNSPTPEQLLGQSDEMSNQLRQILSAKGQQVPANTPLSTLVKLARIGSIQKSVGGGGVSVDNSIVNIIKRLRQYGLPVPENATQDQIAQVVREALGQGRIRPGDVQRLIRGE